MILPDTVTQDEKDLFEDLLASMTHYQRQEGPPEYIEVPTYKIPVSEDEGLELEEEKTSTKVAKGIEKGKHNRYLISLAQDQIWGLSLLDWPTEPAVEILL